MIDNAYIVMLYNNPSTFFLSSQEAIDYCESQQDRYKKSRYVLELTRGKHCGTYNMIWAGWW